jgi:hypothetical protein
LASYSTWAIYTMSTWLASPSSAQTA